VNRKSYIIAGIGVVLIAIVLLFGLDTPNVPVAASDATQSAATDAGTGEPLSVYADGIIIRNGPLLKPDVWYVGIEHEGKHLAVELVFDENSICVGRTASGVCAPDIFIEDRSVHVEGIVDGDAMRVLELTFTKPLQ
jgi:hypothetical protein